MAGDRISVRFGQFWVAGPTPPAVTACTETPTPGGPACSITSSMPSPFKSSVWMRTGMAPNGTETGGPNPEAEPDCTVISGAFAAQLEWTRSG